MGCADLVDIVNAHAGIATSNGLVLYSAKTSSVIEVRDYSDGGRLHDLVHTIKLDISVASLSSSHDKIVASCDQGRYFYVFDSAFTCTRCYRGQHATQVYDRPQISIIDGKEMLIVNSASMTTHLFPLEQERPSSSGLGFRRALTTHYIKSDIKLRIKEVMGV